MKRWVASADGLTALRVPLAAVFPALEDSRVRAGVIALAAVSDVAEGVVARRHGSSRLGAVLDPVADKIAARRVGA